MVISEERKEWNRSRTMTGVLPKIICIRVIFQTITSSINIQAPLEVANKSFSKVKVNQKTKNTRLIQGMRRTQANLMVGVIIIFKFIILIKPDPQIECLISLVLLRLKLIQAIITGLFHSITQVGHITLSVGSNKTRFFSAEMEATSQTIMKISIGPRYHPLEELNHRT